MTQHTMCHKSACAYFVIVVSIVVLVDIFPFLIRDKIHKRILIPSICTEFRVFESLEQVFFLILQKQIFFTILKKYDKRGNLILTFKKCTL